MRDRSRPPPSTGSRVPAAAHEFNTTSAAMTMLALDTYARSNATFIDKLHIEQVGSKGEIKSIATVQNGLLQAGSWSGNARVRFVNASPFPPGMSWIRKATTATFRRPRSAMAWNYARTTPMRVAMSSTMSSWDGKSMSM